MVLAVFGSTGATGNELVNQALEKKYKVKALVRNPKKITFSNKNLTVIAGDILDKKKVSQTIKDTDAVISTLGTSSGAKQLVLRDGTKNIIAAMEQYKIKRLIVQSSHPMVGDIQDVDLVSKLMILLVRILSKITVEDKKEQEKLIRVSGLDWTIVRPVTLTNGERKGAYRVGEHIKTNILDKIARADVAQFLLKIVEDRHLFQKTVTISS